MRGIPRAVAAILSLVPTRTLAFPDAVADTVRSGAPHGLDDDAATPVLLDARYLNGPDARGEDHDAAAAADRVDPVEQWLDSLTNPQDDVASTFTSSLFSTLTFTMSPSSITSIPQHSTPTFVSGQHVTSTRSASDPTPTMDDTRHDHHGSQKLLVELDVSFFSDLIRSAKEKLKSVGSKFCPSHNSDRLHSPGGSEQHPISLPKIIHDEAAEDGREQDDLHLSSAVADKYATASALATPSRPLLNHASPSSSAAIIPTAALASISAVTQAVTSLPASDASSDPTADTSSVLSHHLLAIILSILATILISCIIFCVLARRNPRRRAERLAEWEECRNKRIYRSAAMKHRIRSWGNATFGRLWLIGSSLTKTQIVGSLTEKDLVIETLLPSDTNDGPASLTREVHDFRNAHEQVEALLYAEEGFRLADVRRKHPADRNRRRTYLWLFGRRRRQRSRANSGSESDAASVHSDSEKSGLNASLVPPPAYQDIAGHATIDDRFLMKIVAADARDTSDRSSVSSLVPTSPKEGSMTLGSHDGVSEKGEY